MSKVSNQLTMLFSSEISLKDFSFSQLIIAVKELFDTEGVPGFVKALMTLIEHRVIKSGVACPHCESVKFHLHGKAEKQLKTSIGIVYLTLARVICLECKKTYSPMMKLFDVDQYSRKSREFEKLVLETITQQSFRRASKNLNDTVGVITPHTTLHNWFHKTDSINMNVNKKVDFLIADGTGYKKHYDDKNSNRGEIRVVIGYNNNGDVIPFGAWSRASWKNIGKYLKSANHPSPDKIKFNPIAKTLITDGEIELVDSLKKLAHNHQRCLFHMTHELVPLLQYRDYTSKDTAVKLSEELNSLLYIDLPEVNTDPLKSMEDRLKIELELKKMTSAIDQFINELKLRGYHKAKVFVENSKSQLFTYITNWIKTGISNPKVTSLVERTMREIKRRIKKIGFAWSEKGAEKMTRLVLLQMSTTKQHWDNHWINKTGSNANIKLSFLGVKVI